MRYLMVLNWTAIALICVTGFATAQNLPLDRDRWMPGADTVAKIDRLALLFKLPDGSPPVATYARYYWGDFEAGRRVIYGHLMTPAWEDFRADKGKVIILSTSARVPQLGDGGCDEINVAYDVENGKMASMSCNPEIPPPPSR